MRVSMRLPGSATGTFNKTQFCIKVDRARVIIADVKPDVIHFFLVCMLNGTLGKGTCNSLTTMIGIHSNICDEICMLFIMPIRDEAGISNNSAVFLPNISAQGQGCGLNGMIRPL